MSVAKAFKKVVVVRLSDHVGEEVHVFPDEAEAEAWLRDEADEYGVDEAGCGDLDSLVVLFGAHHATVDVYGATLHWAVPR